MPNDIESQPKNDQLPEKVEELFLLRLRHKEGRPVKTGGNQPFLLDGPHRIWVVYTGKVDVFSVRLQAGEVVGVRTYLTSAQPGQAVFGMDLAPSGGEFGLLAVGVGETELIELDQSRLGMLAQNPKWAEPVTTLLNDWVIRLSAAMAWEVPPKSSEPLLPEKELSFGENTVAFPPKGVVWVKHLTGHSYFLGRTDLPPLNRHDFLPISSHTWLHIADQSQLYTINTSAFIKQDPAWTGLENLHQLLLAWVQGQAAQIDTAEAKRQKSQEAVQRAQMSNALAQFAAILNPEIKTFLNQDYQDPLIEACRLIGQAQGLTIRPPVSVRSDSPRQELLVGIARASKIQMRQVGLKGQWWRQDNGPLLAFRTEGKSPVALLPTSAQSYELVDPVAETRQPLTPELAYSLMHLAYCFYRPLPEQVLTGLDLLKFGARGLKKDLAMIGLMGLAIGLLSLAVPESIRILVDEIIPLADRSQLLSLTLGLLAVAIGGGLFQLAQGFALLRVETKADSAIQAAIWDRLLRLPVAFFRRFSAGDLADRANGVSLIRQILTGVTLTTLLAGLFSLLNFFLLFWYSWQLAVVAVGLTVLAVAALSLTSVFQLSYRRRMVERQGKISGLLLQILTAISKFRVTGTESRAFTVWAREFFRQQELTYRAERVENYLTTFNVSYPLATTMVVFTMLVYFNGRSGDSSASLSLGTFLAFSAAFGQFLNAGLNLTATALQISTVVPIYERIKPILQTIPEVDEAKSDPAELSGEIEMSHVSFRYAPDMPLVLDDISFQIKPREFVAFVGPSGAGKSTLIRLLLGFETAESGSIYYDGQDLNMLNIQGVRHQIGTVLQNGELIAGDIFTNIIGSSLLAAKEAWEAAHQAGLAEDIKQMPMGMHTIIGEGGGAFSGGQRQRLLIARSLINRPRIILFDEATSSLDNRTQAIVSQSLERLQATRLVVAHRLSTIINADRIFVLQAGKIVQQGTYQELMEQPGPFAELAERQLA